MTEHPNPTRWWWHRRTGYYVGMAWALVQTLGWVALAVRDGEALGSLGAVIGWSYGVSVTLILAYYGNTAVEEHVRGRLGR